MTKVQMAPGIPNEKSRTVRPVHGPATIHLPLQVYALPFREASVISLRYTTVFPASLPDILGFPSRVERTPPVCGSALCSPLLSPFGLECVTVFDPAPLCASPLTEACLRF